jgi:hypothetical protein
LFATEMAGGGEVQIVADLELAGVEQEERGDQMRFAPDEAELAAKLLFPVGHVTRTPPPPGARGCGINHAES